MTDTVITLPRSVVEQALEALEWAFPNSVRLTADHRNAVDSLRAALDQKCPCGATQQSQIDECAYANCAALDQPVEQEPVGAVLVNCESREGVMFYSADMIPEPATLKDQFELVKVYTHPQNLHCKSTQARLATLWGYVKEQPKRGPLPEDLKLAIESMIESHESGDLDGWEVQLVKRRLHEAINGIGGGK